MTKENKLIDNMKRKIRTLFLSLIVIMILVLMYYSSENVPVVGKFLDFLKNILWYFQVSNTFEYTIPASDLQPGEVVGYRSYAQDTSGKWNVSEIRTFAVQGITTTTLPGVTTTIPPGTTSTTTTTTIITTTVPSEETTTSTTIPIPGGRVTTTLPSTTTTTTLPKGVSRISLKLIATAIGTIVALITIFFVITKL